MHAVVAQSTFRSQNVLKAANVRTTFGRSDVEKVHAVVVPSQNVQSTPGSEHFWKFKCRCASQVQGIVHLVKSEKNVRAL